jgi:hypothetical protein
MEARDAIGNGEIKDGKIKDVSALQGAANDLFPQLRPMPAQMSH